MLNLNVVEINGCYIYERILNAAVFIDGKVMVSIELVQFICGSLSQLSTGK